MTKYKPQLPFSTPLYLLIPTYEKEIKKGVQTKKYPKPTNEMINRSTHTRDFSHELVE